MKKDKTELVLIIDRSGSMADVKEDAEGGVNTFIDEQKKIEGEVNLTLIEFDDEYEIVHAGVPLDSIGHYSLSPKGNTALLDAVGKTIVTVGERFSKTVEEERAEHVIVVIVTDGQENSSREYTLARVKEMVEHQQGAYNWKFLFIGADANTFADGRAMGFRAAQTAVYDPKNSQGTFLALSSAVGRTRCCGTPDFTPQERADMVEDKEGVVE